MELVFQDMDLLLVRFWAIEFVTEVLRAQFNFIDGLAKLCQVGFCNGLLEFGNSAAEEAPQTLG